MTNYNQSGPIYQQQMAGTQQGLYAQGYAGTNPQHVSHQNAQSTYGATNQAMNQQQGYQTGTHFHGPQSVLHSGFSGTDVQHVRQQNAQSTQNVGQHMITHQTTGHPAAVGYQQVGTPITGSQAAFQSGFAGTDVQHVRQQNAQSIQGTTAYQPVYQQSYANNQYTGAPISSQQAIFQPGFAGTDVDQVRQQNSHSGQGTNYQTYGQNTYQPMGGQYTVPNSIHQPGFAGTDVQHVRQQNIQAQYGTGYGIQTTGYQTGVNSYGHFTAPQAVYQSGFAGTDTDHVRQQNAAIHNSYNQSHF
jgi:hypothetical protein